MATAVGGVPDILTAREGALIILDDNRELANALIRIPSQPEIANQQAKLARTRLNERYAIEPWLERYEVDCRAILTTKTPG